MKIEITKRTKAGARKVLIDGQNIANRVLEFEVNYRSGRPSTVRLLLAPDELVLEDSTPESSENK